MDETNANGSRPTLAATCSVYNVKLSIAQLFIYAYSPWYTRGSWIITGLTGLLILTYYHTYRSVRAIRRRYTVKLEKPL